ncbi:hypothetical protein RhiJN_26709 [Ceratobasidium sp. AG-Ba]|nr:hypothetical protein RhiJN_12660 [Ceratobasidium sp. AG-Ba]QRV98690.1 hypothetical protein RhiJN_26709 [Ceratobasidium sp. AG-Ba]
MVRISALVSLVFAVAAVARPLPYLESAVIKRTAFVEQDYAAVQISDGVTGNAQAEAAKVFVDPFTGRDLATVTAAELKAVQTMREAAEAAETDKFNPEIKAASGAEATALQNGKIKNKVFKLTAEVQALNIKIAQGKAAGKDVSSSETSLAAEQKKLNNNIATDKKNAGQASKGVA